MTDYRKRILFDAETIARRVKELAGEIAAKHPEGDLVLIGILKGSFVFMADLVRALDSPCQIDFVRISSYKSATVSSGELEITMDISVPIGGKHVIVVDDIVDTGLTLSQYVKRLEKESPASVEIAALIDKTGRREQYVKLDYRGFSIEKGFVVGYGLDWDERFRYLPAVYALEDTE